MVTVAAIAGTGNKADVTSGGRGISDNRTTHSRGNSYIKNRIRKSDFLYQAWVRLGMMVRNTNYHYTVQPCNMHTHGSEVSNVWRWPLLQGLYQTSEHVRPGVSTNVLYREVATNGGFKLYIYIDLFFL